MHVSILKVILAFITNYYAVKIDVNGAENEVKEMVIQICVPNSTFFIPFPSDDITISTCVSRNVRKISYVIFMG